MKTETSPADYEKLVAKGRQVLEELDGALVKRGHEYVPLKEIAPRYDTLLDSGRKPGLEQNDGLTNFLSDNGCPVEDHVFVEIHNPGYTAKPSPYQNFIHKSGSDILCMFNYAACDQHYKKPGQMF
ncbi:hypothetical protein F66182_7521 [Fusarium sp. NRRL 66182]|nr:hypothetical protein F66182_7521 [Fusarium sp. NRRL 66182]